MPSAISGRGVLTAVLTALGLIVAATAGYIAVMLTIFSGDDWDLTDLTVNSVVWRSVVTGLVVVIGTRLACGVALKRGVPGAVGAVGTGMVLAGIALVAGSLGHIMFGERVIEGSSRWLIDLVAWSLAGAVGLIWAQLRTTPAPVNGYPTRATATWR